MSIFSKESLEKLRQRIDLVDVLSSHIDFKRSGAAYKAVCPFHDEKTPSFMIQKGDTHYHCYGCGAHGDAIQFLMTHLKMNFSDSVESLAQKFHVHLEHIEGEENKGPNKSLLKEALEQACQFYHFFLLHTPEGHAVLSYLFKRGIDLDFIRRFQIGLAPAKQGMMRKLLHTKYVKDTTMVEAGLLTETANGGYRDFFSDRITFPIRDAAGAVIGFSARKYKEETFGGKYVNTHETALFKKSRVLFGLNYCRKRIAKERKAIIVEGQIDALRLIHTGFNITVAGQGTAFGEGHVKELMNLGVNQVFLALDADEAGKTATLKIGNLFQKEGIEVRIVQMPLGCDPDLYLKEYGPDQFLKLLEESGDYLTFLVQQHSRKLDITSPAGKNELLKDLVKQIRSWDHPLMVHESLRKLAQITKTPEDMIGVGQEHMPNIYIKSAASVGTQHINPDRILESDLLRLLLLIGTSLPHLVEITRMNLTVEHFREPVCKQLYQAYIENYLAKQPCDFLTLAIQMGSHDGQELIAELSQKRINKDKAEESLIEAIQKLLNRQWMEQRESIKQKIHSGLSSDDEVLLLVKQFDQVKSTPPQIQK